MIANIGIISDLLRTHLTFYSLPLLPLKYAPSTTNIRACLKSHRSQRRWTAPSRLNFHIAEIIHQIRQRTPHHKFSRATNLYIVNHNLNTFLCKKINGRELRCPSEIRFAIKTNMNLNPPRILHASHKSRQDPRIVRMYLATLARTRAKRSVRCTWRAVDGERRGGNATARTSTSRMPHTWNCCSPSPRTARLVRNQDRRPAGVGLMLRPRRTGGQLYHAVCVERVRTEA
jgi:hypothetical protein